VCGKSEEAIVAVKRLIPVEPRASTCAMLSEKRRDLVDGNIYDRKQLVALRQKLSDKAKWDKPMNVCRKSQLHMESRMRENRTYGLTRGMWQRSTVELARHRQTKGPANG